METDEYILPDKTQTSHHCYHCGEEIKEEVITLDEHQFCCQGCSLVYDVLKENDLCRYYTIDGSNGNSPDGSYFQGKYDYLDLPEISAKILEFSDGKLSRVNWYIPKMHCSSCIWLLEQLHRLNPAIRSSVVNFPEKKVRITFDATSVQLSQLAALITSIGYEPYLSLNDIEGKQLSRWNRTRLYKIGIAGFAFGNIMMMSFPEYFHLGKNGTDHQLKMMFSVLNIALSIPVFFYCAADFFKSAWTALKARYFNIEAPIALALSCVFLTSLYQVATGTGPGYFDSLAGAVFFMLIGRYFQDKTYAGISFNRDYKSYFPVAISVLKDGQEQRTPITELKQNDRMLVRNEELIPADSVLCSPRAMINYSFVSGEAEPVLRQKGDTIYAGGKQNGPSIELEVLRPVAQGYLTQLWNNDTFTKEKEDQQQTLAARINRYFSAAVLSLAVITFLVWLLIAQKPETAFNAFTTILLVACPCALLLSSTFTNGNLLGLFGKHRFYPKNAHAIERLSHINTIVFDKTGTITLGDEAEVNYVGRELSDTELVMIKTIASQSSHPLSRTLAKSLPHVQASKRVLSEYEETGGAGIKALWGKTEVKLGSARWVGADTDKLPGTNSLVYVSIDGQVPGYFTFKSKYRPELAETISVLQKSGYETYLLSGDKPTDKEFLKTIFQDETRIFFEQKPEEKLRFIEQLQKNRNARVLMVGDGLNDAGALKQSDVGLAVSDDINNFSPSCDAIVEGAQLAALPGYINLARSGQRTIKISFAISLLYNAIGVSFAVAGKLSPVIAAILMPVSSISIVAFTTLATNLAARKWIKN
ncbi:putative copper-importing P-type ATPase A [Dyadobacter sp. CECT 9275]|uniref:Copper-importing P-type ATPase A n=1 Tax=Dyadobacter helix TaxID=2822344 RepID=A0A916JD46_9BACT|nr:heavy metal translocating P-type ATPase metal-binding domain-containing protein [Dyadobacter sp. CECT 9275]CAG5004214.1 putative copper-importing P-type ATPase A [Dyadobacter sp. CECT 9275]